jgi:hypothetical protein
MAGILDRPITVRLPSGRRWWQLWKPRWRFEKMTMPEIQRMQNDVHQRLLDSLHAGTKPTS